MMHNDSPRYRSQRALSYPSLNIKSMQLLSLAEHIPATIAHIISPLSYSKRMGKHTHQGRIIIGIFTRLGTLSACLKEERGEQTGDKRRGRELFSV